MRDIDAVWRTLADQALAGRRDWQSAADLAREAGVGEKLTYKALTKPVSIGAVTRYSGGGFSAVDPERLVTLLASARSLSDARQTSLEDVRVLMESTDQYALGGSRAAVHHLGGQNTIASHAPAIVYVPQSADLSGVPEGDGALIVSAKEHALSTWVDGYTSPAQTYADLFAQPGWQASEFRRALWRAWFTVDDWSLAEESVA